MQRSWELWLSSIGSDTSYNLDLGKIGGASGGCELHLNFRVVVREEAEQVEILDGHSAERGVPGLEEVVDEQDGGDLDGAVGVLPQRPPEGGTRD